MPELAQKSDAAIDPGKFAFVENNVDENDMSVVKEVFESGEQPEENAAAIDEQAVTAEQVAAFLKAAYKVQGAVTYPDLFVQKDEWFLEVATGILPQITALCERFAALGHAIRTVDAAGSWGKLGLDLGVRWFYVIQRKKREKLEKLKEQERIA